MEARDALELGELRKWEDLPIDCLAKIFEGAGTESLIFSLPLVCKNWHTASLDPQCWKVLDFDSVIQSTLQKYTSYSLSLVESFHELVKFAVDRSQGIATKVVLGYTDPEYENIMTYISDGCPRLKSLVLYEASEPRDEDMGCISKLIKKWKDLEHLSVFCGDHFDEIISEVSDHCSNFASLTTCKEISCADATTIATYLPNIKSLTLSGSRLDRQDLKIILAGCRELEFLDVTHCEGFDEDDADILKEASHIKTFLSEGSGENNYDYDYDNFQDDYPLDDYPGW
ncbi:hypothetical protein ACHQM5_013957 [Ranunculus cassubicifolius]